MHFDTLKKIKFFDNRVMIYNTSMFSIYGSFRIQTYHLRIISTMPNQLS